MANTREKKKAGKKDAERIARWRLRQRSEGLTPHEIWATREEFAKLKEFLEALRQKEKAATPPADTGDAA